MASAPSIAGLDPHTSSDDTHGMDDAPPKFSEIFDIDNLEHMKYAASLFCGDTYGHVDSMRNKYTPEDGGIVGLHAIIANRLSIEYLNDFFMKESTKRIRNSSADSMHLDNNFSQRFTGESLDQRRRYRIIESKWWGAGNKYNGQRYVCPVVIVFKEHALILIFLNIYSSLDSAAGHLVTLKLF